MYIHPISRIDASGVQQLFDNSHSLEPRAVAAQVVVMTSLSILTIITFNVLRPKYTALYEPKLKYHDRNKRPPHVSRSFFGWVSPLIHNHEPELFDKIGLDAIAFLRFLHLVRWTFTLIALVACGLLVPIDFLYTLSIKPAQYDFFSAMSIQHIQGVRLYAHIGTSYAIVLFLMLFVYKHWKAMYHLRSHWLRSHEYQQSFYARTLWVSNIPERRRSDQGLQKIFVNMQLPYEVTSVHIGRHVGSLPELIEEHEEAIKKLEEVIEKYTKDGELSDQRPTIIVDGCYGGRKDAIKYYTSQIKNTEAAIEQYRAQLTMSRTESYGFATMATIDEAHAAARELKGQHPKGLTIKLAPNPKDIIWHNIHLSKRNRRTRRVVGLAILLFFCLLSLVPLFPVASLANLDALAESGYIPFLTSWQATSPFTYALVSGVLPPTVSAIVGVFVPLLIRWLSKHMGPITYSNLDRLVIARYFAFLIISQLIIFTLLGVVFNSVLEIIEAIQSEGASLHTVIENLDKLPARLTRTYVDQSSFWLKWFPLQGFLIIFDLSKLVDLIWLSFRTRVYGQTPREIQENMKPKHFNYALHYSKLLFMTTVGLLFAPLAPLVSLAAAIVFWLCSWVYKYQLIYMSVTRVETGGRTWNVVINRVIFAAMFMQVVSILTVALQSQFRSLQFLASIPPLLALLLFKHYLNRRFGDDFEYYIPNAEDLSRAIVHTAESDQRGNKLGSRYLHPALHAQLSTPMVHSRVVPLLRRIYKGKHSDINRVRSRGIGSKNDREKRIEFEDEEVEGVVFIPVHEDQLEYDPELYKRDRSIDHDFDSAPGRLSRPYENQLKTLPPLPHLLGPPRISGHEMTSVSKFNNDPAEANSRRHDRRLSFTTPGPSQSEIITQSGNESMQPPRYTSRRSSRSHRQTQRYSRQNTATNGLVNNHLP